MNRDAKALLLLAAVVLTTTLPFVRRAYFVDDYYFVTMAKGILQRPWRPYDFKSDDAGIGNVGWKRTERPRMVNPPLFHYYLAGVIALVGDTTWKLRVASLPFSFVALFSMYFLGKRLVPDPLTPALLMALTPAYWLTSYSLLLDGALVALLLVSLLVFFIGQEKKSLGWIVASGLLMGMTMLVKYSGVIVVMLAFSWQCLDAKRRSWKPGYASYLVFLIVQLLWGAWNIATYGQLHFLAALPRGMSAPSALVWAQKALVLGSFIGGSLLFVMLAPAMLWRKSKLWIAGLLLLAGGLYYLFSSRAGGFGGMQSTLLALFLTGSISFFVLMGRVMKPSMYKNDMFIMLWVFLGIAELVVVMPWTAGRYLLCVLPALCWVFGILVEESKWPRLWAVALVSTAVTGLLVAHADYAQANTILAMSNVLRERAADLEVLAPRPAHRWYYLGDTFTGYAPYLGPQGWEAAFPTTVFHRGDLLLRPRYRTSSWWALPRTLKLNPVLSEEFRSRNPLRVMDLQGSAGFYASVWGALPFVVTQHPLEQFDLYQVR